MSRKQVRSAKPDLNAEPMHQAALARRLDVNKSVVSRRKAKADFREWSQGRDPDGVAWVYDPKDEVFVRAGG